jgi:hypothetical protein
MITYEIHNIRNGLLTQHSLKNFIIPWKDPEDIPRRERNVKKEAYFAQNLLLFARLLKYRQ